MKKSSLTEFLAVNGTALLAMAPAHAAAMQAGQEMAKKKALSD